MNIYRVVIRFQDGDTHTQLVTGTNDTAVYESAFGLFPNRTISTVETHHIRSMFMNIYRLVIKFSDGGTHVQLIAGPNEAAIHDAAYSLFPGRTVSAIETFLIRGM